MEHWSLIYKQPLLKIISTKPPIISYRKGKSLKDILVRPKLKFEGDNATRPRKPHEKSVSVCLYLYSHVLHDKKQNVVNGDVICSPIDQ